MNLSVIIPLYNTKIEYVKECIESCINKGYEVILVNDGSTVDYSQILCNYPNIKYIKTENKGLSAARNLGMTLATRKYITFLDSDDLIIPTGINKMLDQSQSNDIVLSRILISQNNELKPNYCYYDDSFKIKDKLDLIKSIMILNQNYTCVDTVWAKIYSKDFLDKNNILFNTNVRNSEDVLFNYECYNKTNEIFFLNESSYIYRVNNESVCHSFVQNLDKRFLAFLKEFEKLLKDMNKEEPLFKEHIYRVIRRLFRKYYTYINDYNDFCIRINDLLSENFILEALEEVSINELNNDQKILLKELRNKDIDSLYKISREARKMNLK